MTNPVSRRHRISDDGSDGGGARTGRRERPTGGIADFASRLLVRAGLCARGVTVTSLVGKSGSGKTFRARLIAEKRGIDVIVDDGLVIFKRSIVAGQWAKKERSLVGAVRRALFAEPALARAARAALREIRFQAVLVTATSPRMAELISKNLWLPAPRETILIEDVATRREIEAALRHRRRAKRHASPVPDIRIRRGILSAISSRLKQTVTRKESASLTVGSHFNERGSVFFSEAALGQMAWHCVKEFDPGIEVLRVSFLEIRGMAVLELSVRIPPWTGGSGRLHELREAVMQGMERGTGIVVSEVRVVVDEIDLAARTGWGPAHRARRGPPRGA